MLYNNCFTSLNFHVSTKIDSVSLLSDSLVKIKINIS